MAATALQLAAQGHLVLRLALDLEVHRHVLGGFGHGSTPYFPFISLLTDAADGGVIHRVVAAESSFGLGHDRRGAAHASTHRQSSGRLASLDGAHTGAADGVRPSHRRLMVAPGTSGQASEQAAHARNVAVVFARLVGAAAKITSVTAPQSTLGLRSISALMGMAQVVGTHAAQGTAVAAKGRMASADKA